MEINHTPQAQDSILPFDPIVLVRDVCRKWLTVLVIAAMVGVGSYILSDLSYAPRYQTTSTLVVTSRSSSGSVYSNLSSASNLAGVFSQLLNSSVFRKTILAEAGVQSFDGTISASVISDTNILSITVTASDPRTAFLIHRAVLSNHQTMTDQVIGSILLEVLQEPVVPSAPVNSSDAMGQAKRMALVAAAAACVVLAWLSYQRDTVRSGREARKKLDCRFLGEIPHERKNKTLRLWLRRRKKSILITNPMTGFRFVETIRKLRRRVEQNMRGGKVLMVTSFLENEGKSTVAVNLALAMAKKYQRVLLIDFDLRKPACAMILEQQWDGQGLRAVLNGEASLPGALELDKASGLHLLLEKKGGTDSGDLVASPNTQVLLEWARNEFDFVVLDLPPMSAVSDAEVMMDLADASLLVVRQNAVPAPALNKAVHTLSKGRAKMIGCVLNNVYSTALSSGQGYGYGRYKGYGKYGHYGHYGSGSPNR